MSKKKKNKNMKEKEFNPDVDTGIGRPVRASIAIGDPNDKYSDLSVKWTDTEKTCPDIPCSG